MTIETTTERIERSGAGTTAETGNLLWLPGVVLAWTAFTTTFLWTVTTRGLFRPEISTWSVMGWGGGGREEGFWAFPTLAALALLLFYLEGRGRLRPLFHALLLSWHLAVTGIVLGGTLAAGDGAYFEGAMWGVRVPLAVLALPFAGFAALTVWWIAREVGGRSRTPTAAWGQIDRRALAIALLLLPAAALSFALGEGFDGPTKLATGLVVVQWILLTRALSHRPSGSSRAARRVDSTAATAGET